MAMDEKNCDETNNKNPLLQTALQTNQLLELLQKEETLALGQ
jgi:hypothetical protein